jgi:hypothetical protein
MTSPGEIDKARGRGDEQCEAQSVIMAWPRKKNKKGPKTYEPRHDRKKILTTKQTRGRGNNSLKIFKKEYPACSVTLRQQCNPDPSAQGLTMVKNHKSRRKNLANFEYPQKNKSRQTTYEARRG